MALPWQRQGCGCGDFPWPGRFCLKQQGQSRRAEISRKKGFIRILIENVVPSDRTMLTCRHVPEATGSPPDEEIRTETGRDMQVRRSHTTLSGFRQSDYRE